MKNISASVLTTDKNLASFALIKSNKFNLNLTIGTVYPILTKYQNEDFEDGEKYVIDDLGKENSSIFTLCEIELYK